MTLQCIHVSLVVHLLEQILIMRTLVFSLPSDHKAHKALMRCTGCRFTPGCLCLAPMLLLLLINLIMKENPYSLSNSSLSWSS